MLVCVLLILIGTVMDVLPALVVVAPVLVPAMIQLGFDPLHFVILMIVLLAAFPALSTWVISLLD